MTTLQLPEVAATSATSMVIPRGGILVASGGRGDAAALAGTASRLARGGEPVTLLGVVPPMDAYVMAAATDLPVSWVDGERRDALLRALRTTVRDTLGHTRDWEVETALGSPPKVIAARSEAMHARLVVMGIGGHGIADRIFGGETTLRTLQQLRAPLLAVHPAATGRVETVVVACDFAPSSIQAATLATTLFPDLARLILVHVRHRYEDSPVLWEEWEREYGRRLPLLFQRLRAHIAPPPGVEVELVTRAGDAAEQIIAVAAERGADVIACGNRGHGLLERLLVGSTVTALVRAAPASVLVSPEPAPEDAARLRATVTFDGQRRPDGDREWEADMDL